MRHYELVTILSPMLNQDEASGKWDEIKSFIVNREGEITSEQIWGTRRLAYPIRKGNYNFLEGSYYLSTFTVDNSFNRELENYLRLDEQVLRSLILNCDGPLPDKPPPGPLTAPSRYIRRDGADARTAADRSRMLRAASATADRVGRRRLLERRQLRLRPAKLRRHQRRHRNRPARLPPPLRKPARPRRRLPSRPQLRNRLQVRSPPLALSPPLPSRRRHPSNPPKPMARRRRKLP